MPSASSAIWSAMASASSWSWVTSTVVVAVSDRIRATSRRSSAAQRGIERAERLVEQHHRRPDRQRPRERDALLLAARELVGIALLQLAQPHQVEQLTHPRAIAARSPKPMLPRTVRCGNSAPSWGT